MKEIKLVFFFLRSFSFVKKKKKKVLIRCKNRHMSDAPSEFLGEWKKRGTVPLWGERGDGGVRGEKHTLVPFINEPTSHRDAGPHAEDFSTGTYWARFMGKQNIHFSPLWLYDINILPAQRAAAVRTVRVRSVWLVLSARGAVNKSGPPL